MAPAESMDIGLTLIADSVEIELTLIEKEAKIALTLISEVLCYGFLSEC